MGQVSVTLNGRTYRLSCGEGEEARLRQLAAHVNGHIEDLVREHGQVGPERLLLMASLLITDELYEARQVTSQAPPEDMAQREAEAAVEAHEAREEPDDLAPRVVPLETRPPRQPIRATAPTPRDIDRLDATALMKGLERKTSKLGTPDT